MKSIGRKVTMEFILWFIGKAQEMTLTDWLIVIFTFGLLVFTGLLYRATNLMAKHSLASERAYVTLSHISPPGLVLDVKTGTILITLRVRNSGRTPATISNLIIRAAALPNGTPLPDSPYYEPERDDASAKAFLATEEDFFHTRVLSLSDGDLVEVLNGNQTLYLFAFVDYMDQFGGRHRGGYARKYDQERDRRENYPSDESFGKRNNLIFVTERYYNYDRERKKDEGFD